MAEPGCGTPTCPQGKTHCDHWWDGDACCRCGAPEMTREEKIAQGMEE